MSSITNYSTNVDKSLMYYCLYNKISIELNGINSLQTSTHQRNIKK